MAQRLIDDIFDALDEQAVVIPGTGTGTGTGTLGIPSLPASWPPSTRSAG
ncbi:hypothetical protein SUDANB130_06622 [Streptomyces sp. enrichment culture]